jgi:hypothetical protein
VAGATKVKADDVGRFLAAMKDGGALPAIEIAQSWRARFLWPGLFVLNVGFQLDDLLTGRRHLDAFQCGLLAIWAVGLWAVAANLRGKLVVSTAGLEIWSGFKHRVYRFADMPEPFRLVQRKWLPGFDVVVPVAEAGGVQGPQKLVPRPLRSYVIEAELVELLNMYRAGFAGA